MKKILGLGIMLLLIAMGFSAIAKAEMANKAHPPIVGSGAGIKNVEVRFDHFYCIKDKLIDGNDSVSDSTDKEITVHKDLLRLYYGLSKNFMLIGFIPSFNKNMEMKDSTGAIIEKEATGLGDIELRGKYRFLKQSPNGPWLSMAVGGGIKFATGVDDEEYNGAPLPASFQPGSGSTDYVLSLLATKKFPSFYLHSNILYQVCTEGSQDYEFGNKFKYNLSLVRPMTRSIDLTLELNGSYASKDEQNDSTIDNTGGNEIFVSPGIKFFTKSKLAIEAAVSINVWRDLNGPQSAADLKVVVGAYYDF